MPLSFFKKVKCFPLQEFILRFGSFDDIHECVMDELVLCYDRIVCTEYASKGALPVLTIAFSLWSILVELFMTLRG